MSCKCDFSVQHKVLVFCEWFLDKIAKIQREPAVDEKNK